MAIVFIRTITVFTLILLSLRIMGKRQLGELELSELVVAVLISDMAALPLQDIGIPMLNGLIPIFTLLACEILISAAAVKSIKFRRFLFGKPSILIQNGCIVQKEMEKNRITLNELSEELRKKSITDISTIKYAFLETDGSLNVLLTSAQTPVTAAMLNIETEEIELPVDVISDGRILSDNLKILKKDENWLNGVLKQYGVSSPKQVYYLTCDSTGKIYFAAKDEKTS